MNSPIGKIMVENTNLLSQQGLPNNQGCTPQTQVKRNLFLSEPSKKSISGNRHNLNTQCLI